MTGNANEWFFDAVNPKYSEKIYQKRSVQNNTDPVFFDASVPDRARRGGSWKHESKLLRVSYRGKNKASRKDAGLGFRLVCTQLDADQQK